MTALHRHLLSMTAFAFFAFALAMQVDENNYPLMNDFHGLLYLCYSFVAISFYHLIRTWDELFRTP